MEVDAASSRDGAVGHVPLQEFFQHSYQDFTLIPTPPGYNASYFANYQGDPEGPPGGPD